MSVLGEVGFLPLLVLAAKICPPGIEGALFAARRQNDFAQFLPFQPQMEALLGYWERERVDPVTGALFTWHDQMESGADNMPTSPCPTVRSACWDESTDANTLASADVATQMAREHRAFAEFLDHWGATAAAPAPAAAPPPPCG